MTDDKIERFRNVEMSMECQPDCKRRGGAGDGGEPGAEDGRHFGEDKGRNAIRQLHQQSERARFFFAPEGPNRNEEEQQRSDEVKSTKRRNQHAIERREAARERGRILPGGARLSIKGNRLEKAVAHERAKAQQHAPQRTPARDLPELLCEQRQNWCMM